MCCLVSVLVQWQLCRMFYASFSLGRCKESVSIQCEVKWITTPQQRLGNIELFLSLNKLCWIGSEGNFCLFFTAFHLESPPLIFVGSLIISYNGFWWYSPLSPTSPTPCLPLHLRVPVFFQIWHVKFMFSIYIFGYGKTYQELHIEDN